MRGFSNREFKFIMIFSIPELDVNALAGPRHRAAWVPQKMLPSPHHCQWSLAAGKCQSGDCIGYHGCRWMIGSKQPLTGGDLQSVANITSPAQPIDPAVPQVAMLFYHYKRRGAVRGYYRAPTRCRIKVLQGSQ